jgi:hypothetical protein
MEEFEKRSDITWQVLKVSVLLPYWKKTIESQKQMQGGQLDIYYKNASLSRDE